MKKNLINVSKSVGLVLLFNTIFELFVLLDNAVTLPIFLKFAGISSGADCIAIPMVFALILKAAGSNKPLQHALEELADCFDFVFGNPAKKLYKKLNFRHK